MSTDRRNLLITIVATSISIAVPASSALAGPASYTIDILSTDRYPQVQDSYMMRINDQGVAAGYIATASVLGPYLPTTYAGSGQFNSLGNESVGLGHYYGLVTGINDGGDVVGNVTSADGSYSPYVERGGVVQTITLPSNSGTATGPRLRHGPRDRRPTAWLMVSTRTRTGYSRSSRRPVPSRHNSRCRTPPSIPTSST